MSDLKLEDLWIGDTLRIISSGKKGSFIGINPKGKARIKYGDKILLIKATNLELLEDEDLFDPTPTESEVHAASGFVKKSFEGKELDLHIEKLAPNLQSQRAEMILQHQLSSCQLFIEDAIMQRKYSIIIIHGKGEGVLKSEVNHLLKNFKEVYFSTEINNGGATEIIFQY